MPEDLNVGDLVPVAQGTSSLVRKVGPALPLAIALLHGTVTGTHGPQPPPGPAPSPVVVQPGTAACGGGSHASPACVAPYPLVAAGHPVDWWFVFKLNSKAFPQCGNGDTRSCPFDVGRSPTSTFTHFGQQFAYASSEHPALQDGGQQ